MCFTQLDPEAPDRRFQFDLVVQPNDTYEGEISTERNARFTPPPASTKHRITLPAISSSPSRPPPLLSVPKTLLPHLTTKPKTVVNMQPQIDVGDLLQELNANNNLGGFLFKVRNAFKAAI